MADDFLSKTNHRAGTLSDLCRHVAANGQPDGELSFLNRYTDGLFPFWPWTGCNALTFTHMSRSHKMQISATQSYLEIMVLCPLNKCAAKTIGIHLRLFAVCLFRTVSWLHDKCLLVSEDTKTNNLGAQRDMEGLWLSNIFCCSGTDGLKGFTDFSVLIELSALLPPSTKKGNHSVCLMHSLNMYNSFTSNSHEWLWQQRGF